MSATDYLGFLIMAAPPGAIAWAASGFTLVRGHMYMRHNVTLESLEKYSTYTRATCDHCDWKIVKTYRHECVFWVNRHCRFPRKVTRWPEK